MVAHWDDVAERRRELGHLRGTWQDLGRAAGTQWIGLKRTRIDGGSWSTPAHAHGREEEIFFVLGGSGLSWQDGETYEIGAGDCLVHRADGTAHTLRADERGLEVLAFGLRARDEGAYLPRAGVMWLAHHYVDAGKPEQPPWAREVAAGPPAVPAAVSPRPSSIVNVGDLRPQERAGATVHRRHRDLGRAAGSLVSGLKHVEAAPGKLNAPPHCHSAEEELFVVLDGEGVLELTPSPDARLRREERDGRHAVRPGSVVARPPGTNVAHAFRAGDGPLTLLAYGTRDANDVAYYPRSNKLFFRGAGLIARLDHVDYWEGED